MRGTASAACAALLCIGMTTALAAQANEPTNGSTGQSTGQSIVDQAAQKQERIKKFVEIEPGRSLYIDFIPPAAGKPTVVLVNGLTYRTGPSCWEFYAKALQALGYGAFMWDMEGQGQVLLHEGPPLKNIDYNDQVRDMALILDAVGLKGPQHLFALSYGSEIGTVFAAKYPERIATLMLAGAPDGPLEMQDNWVKQQIAINRVTVPFNPASYEDLYAYFYRILVYATYPSVEPIVLENPYKLEAIFRLGLGVKNFSSKDYVGRLPAHSTFLLVAGEDQYVPRTISDGLWRDIPTENRMARIVIEGSEHKIPEAVPAYAAELTRMIIERDPRLADSRTFVGVPKTGALKELTVAPTESSLAVQRGGSCAEFAIGK